MDIPPIVWKAVRQFPALLTTRFREKLFGSTKGDGLEELRRLEKEAKERRPAKDR